ncbi:response regulator transcription factor [Hydrogenophaga sp. 5NK40-0174]|uniref:response regulator transcription factor n=1 Tax=Hydrogenophaga sp. 5NK40-0174 TaxID=3127649 RepID=UPI00310864AA
MASPSAIRVLMIDDDVELSGMVAEWLEREGMTVVLAHTGKDGWSSAIRESPDVLLLDLMLPDMNGLDLCRRLRAEGQSWPVLMLTAKGDPIDRVLGLELGADDYLGKPFEPRELVARVRALARRMQTAHSHAVWRFGELVLDLVARRVTCGGQAVSLTSSEFKLLAALANRPGVCVDRQALSAAVQPGNYAPLERSVDVQVARLRKKLAAAPGGWDWITTVRGEGYVFTVPVDR